MKTTDLNIDLIVELLEKYKDEWIPSKEFIRKIKVLTFEEIRIEEDSLLGFTSYDIYVDKNRITTTPSQSKKIKKVIKKHGLLSADRFKEKEHREKEFINSDIKNKLHIIAREKAKIESIKEEPESTKENPVDLIVKNIEKNPKQWQIKSKHSITNFEKQIIIFLSLPDSNDYRICYLSDHHDFLNLTEEDNRKIDKAVKNNYHLMDNQIQPSDKAILESLKNE